jgi:hypothetical protein
MFVTNRNEGQYVVRVSQYGVATTVPKLLVSGMYRTSHHSADWSIHVIQAILADSCKSGLHVQKDLVLSFRMWMRR